MAPIRKRPGLGLLHASDAQIANHRRGLGLDHLDRPRRRPGVEALRVACLHCEADVLFNGQRREQIGDLERSSDSCLGDSLRGETGNGVPPEKHVAFIRGVESGNHVEGRRLARAVRADQGVESAVAHGNVHALDGPERAEAFADLPGFQDDTV